MYNFNVRTKPYGQAGSPSEILEPGTDKIGYPMSRHSVKRIAQPEWGHNLQTGSMWAAPRPWAQEDTGLRG